MNVKKNPFSEMTPSQRLLLQGGTPYNIEENKPTSKVSGILYRTYNPVLITPSTLDELVSAKGELNFLLIYNLIEEWTNSPDKRKWDPKEAVESVFDDLKEKKPEQFDLILADKLNFVAWFQTIPEYESDFFISNPPKQSLVINCSSFPNPINDSEKKELADQSRRLPLGHFLRSANKMNPRPATYTWLYHNYLTREFAWVRPSPEQYKLIDSTKYTMGSASMLTNGLPGVGKSTDLQISAIELILQAGPNRGSRKLLYFTHDNTQKRIALQEIQSILRVTYCATDKDVKKVTDSIQFESRKKMFGNIFSGPTSELETSNFNNFLEVLDISASQIHQKQEFYQAAAENFLKIVLGWFGSISKFREFTRNKTFQDVMDSKVQLFQIHENHTKDDNLPVLKIKDHWKGGGVGTFNSHWEEKDWNNFNQLLNKISDSKKLRSYENENGEYWTYSINCGIIDEAYRRLFSKDESIKNNAESKWLNKLRAPADDDIDDKEENTNSNDAKYMELNNIKSIWYLKKKNKFDAIIVDEVQNFSPISLSILLKHQSNRSLEREMSSSRRPVNVSPFIMKASGDEFQSMTSNTFFDQNRHTIDIFKGWGTFARDEGAANKSGTGVAEIKKQYLKENHRNSKPIVKLLNTLYGHLIDKARRTPKTKKVIFASGAKTGALIDLTNSESGIYDSQARDLLYVVASSLNDQMEQKDSYDQDAPSRNTFLIIPEDDMANDSIETIIEKIMKHVEAFFQIVWEKDEKDEKIQKFKNHLKELEGVNYAEGKTDEFRSLLLFRGIASVKDVQGLTVEAAIVSGLREKGRDEFRHKQEAFVAFSRPRKVLLISDRSEELGEFWRDDIPIKTEIDITQEKLEEYIKSKKGTDFHFFFRHSLEAPYSKIRWRNTLQAITHAKKGYSGILKIKDYSPGQTDYSELENIIKKMSEIFENYAEGKLLETWDSINELEDEIKIQESASKFPKELHDFRDLFDEGSIFQLKHYLALQFLHRYGVDEKIRKKAPDWIKKLENKENNFFNELYIKCQNTRWRSEYSLCVIFYNTLKLIYNRKISPEEENKIHRNIGEVRTRLVREYGHNQVSSLRSPDKGKGLTHQSNLESSILVGLKQDNLWNFPFPSSDTSSFHYMPVEGEWSLRPKQIYLSFFKLINELEDHSSLDISTEVHKLICEFAALSYINDDDASIIKLIDKNPIAPVKALESINKLLESQTHSNLFSDLVTKYGDNVADTLSTDNIPALQKKLVKYREYLLPSCLGGELLFHALIRKIEEKKKPSDKEYPWFVREKYNSVRYTDSEYNRSLQKGSDNSVSYSFVWDNYLTQDWINASTDNAKATNYPTDASFFKKVFGSSNEDNNDKSLPLTDKIIKAFEGNSLSNLEESKYLEFIIPKIIEDEGDSAFNFFMGNCPNLKEGVNYDDFLLGKNKRFQSQKKHFRRMEAQVKLCIYLHNRYVSMMAQEKAPPAAANKAKREANANPQMIRPTEKFQKLAKQFLRKMIIAISLNYILNKPMKRGKEGVIDLEEIWKLITTGIKIDDLFEETPFGTLLTKNYGNTNIGESDGEIFGNIKENIGFQNWQLLDMSLQSSGNQLRHKIWTRYPNFEFGLLGDEKSGFLSNGTNIWHQYHGQEINHPWYNYPKWNKYLLSRLPNRPINGSKSLVRYQYLNKYTFKIIDSIIRGGLALKDNLPLEKIDYIHSGLIEEWVIRQLNGKDPNRKDILTAIIQTMYASKSDKEYKPIKSNNIPSPEKILENLNGTIKKGKKNSEIIFSFEIGHKRQLNKWFSKSSTKGLNNAALHEKKTDDQRLRQKEKLAEILAYLPYLAALEDEKTVHTEIIISKNIGHLYDTSSEHIKQTNRKGEPLVLTLILLNKEDEGLPLKTWYEENFKIIREINPDPSTARLSDIQRKENKARFDRNARIEKARNEGNEQKPYDILDMVVRYEERDLFDHDRRQFLSPEELEVKKMNDSLFRFNNLPFVSPLVHIAALLDTTATPAEIKKQLSTYYPSLKSVIDTEISRRLIIGEGDNFDKKIKEFTHRMHKAANEEDYEYAALIKRQIAELEENRGDN